jgi:hypothetical protein
MIILIHVLSFYPGVSLLTLWYKTYEFSYSGTCFLPSYRDSYPNIMKVLNSSGNFHTWYQTAVSIPWAWNEISHPGTNKNFTPRYKQIFFPRNPLHPSRIASFKLGVNVILHCSRNLLRWLGPLSRGSPTSASTVASVSTAECRHSDHFVDIQESGHSRRNHFSLPYLFSHFLYWKLCHGKRGGKFHCMTWSVPWALPPSNTVV